MSTPTLEMTRTERRESREGYARFLLARAGLEPSDVEDFLNTRQAAFDGLSPLEMIYTGEYDRAVKAVESFADDLHFEDE